MIFKAGFREITLLWMMVLLQSLDGRHIGEVGQTYLSCKPKQLASLTKHQLETTLIIFELSLVFVDCLQDDANGKHLGKWPPGFPALSVEHNPPIIVNKVQCSLLFLVQGLDKILEDQRDYLNHEGVPLHGALKESISRVGQLAACLRGVLGGKCSPQPKPPNMPNTAFERKQWSHTLLTAATEYLGWLEHKLLLHSLKKSCTINIKQKATRPEYQKYVVGSGFLL